MLSHLGRHWKRYLALAGGVLVAGLAAKGYIPPAVADWLSAILVGIGAS